MKNDKTNGQIINVCGGEPLKMRYYTEKLIELSKINDIKMEIDEKLWRPIDIYYQDGDNQLCKDLVDWKPKYKIDETLEDLLNYWLNKIN